MQKYNLITYALTDWSRMLCIWLSSLFNFRYKDYYTKAIMQVILKEILKVV